ncbi:MAG: serine/threonine-protein kinase [Phycisphaerales bacterium]
MRPDQPPSPRPYLDAPTAPGAAIPPAGRAAPFVPGGIAASDDATSMTGAPDPSSASGSATFTDDIRTSEPVPESIGPYRIIRQIGQGGMGAVYLATRAEQDPPRPLALKIMRAGFTAEELVMRFRRERSVLAALDHPNIAKLFDAGETDRGEPYFVMEYVDGQSLDEYCDSRRLTVRERLDLYRQVCAAVHHAHTNLVVHRDIKPKNILVTADGVPKLLDFGIAKLISHTGGSGPDLPTAPEVRAMTPEYASPEQIRGLPVSTGSDIYSLGVVLYELLSGHRPYRFMTRALREVERTVCEADPPRPSTRVTETEQAVGVDELGNVVTTGKPIAAEEVAKARGESTAKLRRQLSRDVDNIVLMAMRKEPQRRYPSAEALSEDIRRYLEGHPVLAAPDSVRYRAWKFVTRNRAGVAAAITVAVTLVVASAAFAWQANVAGRERDEADRQRDIADRQRAEAVVQRDRADRRFSELRSLAKVFLFDVHDAILRLEGSTAARQLLVTQGLKYLDGLREEAGGDVTLLEEVAQGYQRLGDVQGGMRAGNLGDTAGALTSYRHGRSILLDLLRDDVARDAADDERLRTRLAATSLGVADMLRRQGDVNEAAELYREAVRLYEPIVAARPDDAAAQRALAMALQSEADLMLKAGDVEGAAPIYDRSVKIRRALLEANPKDVELRRTLATAVLRLGRIAEGRGDFDLALRHYRDNVEIRTALADEQPGDARLQRDVAGARRTLGELLRTTNQLDEALVEHTAAFKVFERLSLADAKNARARLDYALASESLGRTLLERNDIVGARANLAKACDLAEELHKKDPADIFALQCGASSHEHLARVLRFEVPEEAIVHQRRALELRREIVRADPNGSAESEDTGQRARVEVLRVIHALGFMLLEIGDIDGARETLESALAEYDAVDKLSPLDEVLRSERQQIKDAIESIDGPPT